MGVKMSFWIGIEGDQYHVGQTGFLVDISNLVRGWTRYDLRDRPAQTNRSFAPRVWGWCGTENDVMTYANGIARVERVARNGRALVRILTGDDAIAVLEELGYPELAEEVDPPTE